MQLRRARQLFLALRHTATLNATARFCILARAPNRTRRCLPTIHRNQTTRNSSFPCFAMQPNHARRLVSAFCLAPQTTRDDAFPQSAATKLHATALSRALPCSHTKRDGSFLHFGVCPPISHLRRIRFRILRSTVLAGCRTLTLCLTIRCRAYEKSTARFNDYECVAAYRAASPQK